MRPEGLLLDENAPHAIREQLVRRDPTLSVLVIGRGPAPPLEAPDPAILRWLDAEGYCLLTYNRATMPTHLGNHPLEGWHVPGLFAVRPNATVGTVIEELLGIWEDDDWEMYADSVTFIPRR